MCVNVSMQAVLLLPLVLLAQDKPPEKCTLAGTVVNYVTGEPLDKVEITTEGFGSRGGSAASATSDARGRFSLANLEPGQYRLKGKRNRFLDTNYGARRAEGSGTPIVIEAGQNIKDLKFKLIPLGVIAGTVRDPEGEPLVRVPVGALRVRFEEGRRKVTAVDAAFTDDMGQYRITGLSPGTYYVRANPQPKSGGGDLVASGAVEGSFFIVTGDLSGINAANSSSLPVLLPALYPGVQDGESARTVDVGIGSRISGIDISLPRSGTVTVKGHVSVPEGARPGMVNLSRGQWLGAALDPRLITNVDEHGDFTFPAVPQGAFTLTATAVTVRPHPQRSPVQVGNEAAPIEVIQGINANLEGRVALEVRNTPIDGVQVTVAAAAEVTGRVSLADGKGPALSGGIEFDDGVNDTRHADISEGQFNLDLPQGRYNVYLNLNPTDQQTPLLLHSATWAGRDILAGGLVISGPGKVSLDVVAAPDGGKCDGVVLDKDDKPVGGATVVLIPEARYRSRGDRYYEAETDQNGRFELDGVAPGEYKAFAWDDVEPGIWRDADFVKAVEAKGEKVTLKSAGHESTRLRVIQ
jgi:hypothetical protein